MNQKKIIVTAIVVILFALSITNLIINIHQTKENEAQKIQINKLIEQNEELTIRLDSDELTILNIIDLIEAQNEYMFLWL